MSVSFNRLFSLLLTLLFLLSCGEESVSDEALGVFRVRFSSEIEHFSPMMPTPSVHAPSPSAEPDGLWASHPLGAELGEAVAARGGAGLSPTIRVPLNAPPALNELIAAMQNESRFDDPVILLALNPAAPDFGQYIELDFGMPNPAAWATEQLLKMEGAPAFGRRPQLWGGGDLPLEALLAPGSVSLLWATHDELDGSGAGQGDLDGDLLVDRPATRDGVAYQGLEAATAILPIYDPDERALLFRPRAPLLPGQSYGVFLTKDIRSLAGDILSSPFPSPFHPDDAQVIRAAIDEGAFPGLREDGLAFAWRFQTGEPSLGWRRLRAVLTQTALPERVIEREEDDLIDRSSESATLTRAELTRWQESPLALEQVDAWWNEQSLSTCRDRDGSACSRSEQYPNSIDGEGAGALAISYAALEGASPAAIEALEESYRFVDQMISGRLTIAALSGSAAARASLDLKALIPTPTTLPFWCAVPKSLNRVSSLRGFESADPPFSTLIWVPERGEGRLSLLRVAGHFARYGLATCSPLLPGESEQDFGLIDGLGQRWRETPWSLEQLRRMSAVSRSGLAPELVEVAPGGVDALSALFQFRLWLSSLTLESGDFDGDGVQDFGGEQTIQIGGIGWGANLALLAATLDPLLESAGVIDPALSASGLPLESAATRWQAPGLLQLVGPLLV
ncbi:MAG: hypothetical protein VYD19_07990, partial [Myxococcota bacterium]|nr:hypothetical protein [Myxococcota bacterium]